MRRIYAVSALLTVCACMWLGSAAAGAVDPNMYQNYFGWSASQQSPGEGLFLQYDYDTSVVDPSNPAIRRTCNESDTPDETMRAFKFQRATPPYEYRVQITLPRGVQNRRMVGTTLHGAIKESDPDNPDKRTCGASITFVGDKHKVTNRADPGKFDSETWLASPYFVPGSTPAEDKVYVLTHHEFHGAFADPAVSDDWCSVPHTNASERDLCWFGSATFTSSCASAAPNALGACYLDVDALPSHLIATIPVQYSIDWGRQGYKEHSNIIRGEKGDDHNYYFFMTIVSAPAGGPQKDGVCLLRTSTNDIGNPQSWMAWDGDGFDNRPSGAYPMPPMPQDHVCKPVIDKAFQPFSLTFNTYLDKYMLLGHFPDSKTVPSHVGVHYMLSDDLRNWSEPQLLLRSPATQDTADTGLCNAMNAVNYPGLFDPSDPAAQWLHPGDNPPPGTPENPNFDHPGISPDLYFKHAARTASPSDNPCDVDMDVVVHGDVARLGISFTQQRQANLNSGLVDPAYGYDATNWLSDGCIGGSYDSPPGQGCATASSLYHGHGFIAAKWKSGDDVWYGSAFYPPSTPPTFPAGVHLMRWDGVGGSYGGITSVTNGFQLVRGSGTSETALGSVFSIPANRWAWVEVHQQLGTTGQPAYSEVFVDGHLVSQSTATNMSSDATINLLRIGFTDAEDKPFTNVGIDRTTILGAQRGTPTAPATPQGFRETDRNGATVTFAWNPVPGVAGYRVWKRTSGGSWVSSSLTSPPYVDNSFTCGQAEYRITSYNTVGSHEEESNVSSVAAPQC
jgi:hypothetical protein